MARGSRTQHLFSNGSGRGAISELPMALHSWEAKLMEAYQQEVAILKQQLASEKEKSQQKWRTNCEHLAEQDAIMATQEAERGALWEQVRELQVGGYKEPPSLTTGTRTLPPVERGPSAETRSCLEKGGEPHERYTSVYASPLAEVGALAGPAWEVTDVDTSHPGDSSSAVVHPPSENVYTTAETGGRRL